MITPTLTAYQSKTEQAIALEDRYGARNYKPLDVVLERGEDIWVYDVEGNRYLDCLSAYSAVNFGHCHPRLVQAMVAQAQRMTLTSRAFRNAEMGKFYEAICNLTGYERVLPMNTGAEAVETAIKAARKWGYQVKGVPPNQAEIIVFENNFHGRTITIISFSSEPKYRADFGPFTPGFLMVPFGDAQAVRQAITRNTVAIMVEPIQGEGGIIVPADGYLRQLRQLCDDHQILLMADEIQTGLGRTGALFACDHEHVRPDVMIIGKALSGGFYPVSAVLSDDTVLGLFRPGDHGSTFGGNPLGLAVAREALQVLIEESLITNAADLGAYFRKRLADIPSHHIRDVRGKGLLIGVELHPAAGGARRFCEALQSRGILSKETHEHTIRFAPPLTITRPDIDWALEHISAVLTRD